MRFLTKGPEETKKIGFGVGRRLTPGSTVCLYGDLGSGKTVFVKGIAAALDIDEKEIMSASFVIISEHRGRMPLYHIDLYRVEKGDIEETGVYDYIGGDGIAVIEWAEKIDVPDAVKVKIGFLSESEREIIVEGFDDEDG